MDGFPTSVAVKLRQTKQTNYKEVSRHIFIKRGFIHIELPINAFTNGAVALLGTIAGGEQSNMQLQQTTSGNLKI